MSKLILPNGREYQPKENPNKPEDLGDLQFQLLNFIHPLIKSSGVFNELGYGTNQFTGQKLLMIKPMKVFADMIPEGDVLPDPEEFTYQVPLPEEEEIKDLKNLTKIASELIRSLFAAYIQGGRTQVYPVVKTEE